MADEVEFMGWDPTFDPVLRWRGRNYVVWQGSLKTVRIMAILTENVGGYLWEFDVNGFNEDDPELRAALIPVWEALRLTKRGYGR